LTASAWGCGLPVLPRRERIVEAISLSVIAKIAVELPCDVNPSAGTAISR
jgi:hypothetical protein